MKSDGASSVLSKLNGIVSVTAPDEEKQTQLDISYLVSAIVATTSPLVPNVIGRCHHCRFVAPAKLWFGEMLSKNGKRREMETIRYASSSCKLGTSRMHTRRK